MTDTHSTPADPARDLVLERVIDISPRQAWRAWTEPQLLMRWFTPAPWTTPHCEIDLRPGGIFRTVMRGPDGEEFDGTGCFLEVDEPRRLVWTSAMGPDFRPQMPAEGGFSFSAILTLEPHPDGCLYRVRLVHGDEQAKTAHEEMGFESGWGKALDQLVELMHGDEGTA